MKVSLSDFNYMVEHQTADVITLLVNGANYSMHEAMDIWFNSQTRVLLNNPKTGLYFQSPRYILSYLEKEIKN
ncbi:MAG: hypothetical protein MJ204_07745 [Bacteroidales bacterium]|nr:hypothetical protein [Bacteroidales bacterium]MCQ2960336.1 hypothetical protein [Bacteroidales bacterium]